jgi:hypothetical protein
LDGSYRYLRQFTPQVLDAVTFAGGTAAGAPQGPRRRAGWFVPARWRGYLDTATKAGNVTAYRHYWELCALLALRDGC